MEKYKDKDWLFKQYWDNKRTIKDIAQECSVSDSTVGNWMNKISIKKRTNQETQQLIKGDKKYRDEKWLRNEYINKKRSVLNLAKEFNCSSATIHKYLKRYNIPIRSQSEAGKLMEHSGQFKKGHIPWIKGKHHSKETLKKISESGKGRIPWHKGVKNPYSKETLKKMSESGKGRIVSEETRKKISEAMKGRVLTEEWKKKISESNSFEKSYNWKGEDANDNAKHLTVRKLKKKPKLCEDCNKEKTLELSFLKHPEEYTRNPEDYRYLCRGCHMKYDYSIGYR